MDALNVWLTGAKIDSGSISRAIDRWGDVSRRALDPKAVNDIVKQTVAAAGLEVSEFSANGVAVGISDGSGKPWRPALRGNGAISASISAAGVKLLQQRYPTAWARRAIVLVIFCFLNIAIRGAFEVE